jgi:hypothetical protein
MDTVALIGFFPVLSNEQLGHGGTRLGAFLGWQYQNPVSNIKNPVCDMSMSPTPK